MILILVCIFILACYKWGDWKNWKSYYSTILFLIAGDFIYSFVSAAKPLWRYNSTIVSGTITGLILSIIIYPCTVLIFLPTFVNSGKMNKFLYITIWVCGFFGLEYLGVKFYYLSYFNGWCYAYSFIFDSILFILLVVHQKSPPLAWLISFIVGVSITLWFNLPALY